MNKINNFNGCPDGKCFLCLIHPKSDAGFACDDKCYFVKGEDGESHLERYIKKYPEQWEIINNKDDKGL
jgi:hypothetical protein